MPPQPTPYPPGTLVRRTNRGRLRWANEEVPRNSQWIVVHAANGSAWLANTRNPTRAKLVCLYQADLDSPEHFQLEKADGVRPEALSTLTSQMRQLIDRQVGRRLETLHLSDLRYVGQGDLVGRRDRPLPLDEDTIPHRKELTVVRITGSPGSATGAVTLSWRKGRGSQRAAISLAFFTDAFFFHNPPLY